MKKRYSLIINFIVLLSIVAILLKFLLCIYSNNKKIAFVMIFLFLLLLSIVKRKIDNKIFNKTVQHFLNGLIIGYKISLIVLVVSLGKYIFNMDANINTYFICYIPSILYIFDSANIKEIVDFCNYEICS
ncbi:MAG: hypothetical protein J6M39_00585 [Lachnospiraceae bacterium]|nr:hypothetical protein [Lachnospiraceae bacterium]